MALSDENLKIVSYIDQFYWENDGKLPTNEFVAEKLKIPVARINKAWKDQNFRQAILARGLQFDKEDNSILTPAQVMLANMLMNTHDRATIREKLKLLNISTQQYTAWLQDKGFQNYIRHRAEQVFKSADPIAYTKLVQAMDSGDLNAIRLFLEMRGIYNPRLDVNVNVDAILQKVIDVVSKHVDPITMAAIADDLEGLTSGPAKLDTSPVRELPASSVMEI